MSIRFFPKKGSSASGVLLLAVIACAGPALAGSESTDQEDVGCPNLAGSFELDAYQIPTRPSSAPTATKVTIRQDRCKQVVFTKAEDQTNVVLTDGRLHVSDQGPGIYEAHFSNSSLVVQGVDEAVVQETSPGLTVGEQYETGTIARNFWRKEFRVEAGGDVVLESSGPNGENMRRIVYKKSR